MFNLRWLTAPLQWMLYQDTVAGAQTQIRLSVDPSLENVSGKYFSSCKETWTMFTAKNDDTAKWLWEKSEELTNHKVKELTNMKEILINSA